MENKKSVEKADIDNLVSTATSFYKTNEIDWLEIFKIINNIYYLKIKKGNYGIDKRVFAKTASTKLPYFFQLTDFGYFESQDTYLKMKKLFSNYIKNETSHSVNLNGIDFIEFISKNKLYLMSNIIVKTDNKRVSKLFVAETGKDLKDCNIIFDEIKALPDFVYHKEKN